MKNNIYVKSKNMVEKLYSAHFKDYDNEFIRGEKKESILIGISIGKLKKHTYVNYKK